MSYEYWMGKHFSYYFNRECEYFPCHLNADPENFNCLFCYCPLYVLGDRCGGTFVYLDNGFKDCSLCLYPHLRENYGKIIDRYQEILLQMPPRRLQGGACANLPPRVLSYEQLLESIERFPNATEREKAAVRTALHYIHTDLSRPLSLEVLVRETKLSRYYFAHAFKKLTGNSPIEYIQQARLEQAKLLLLTTTLSVEAIALQVGYQTGSSFSSLFSKKLGVSPGEYRRQAKSQPQKQD